jgi:Family of unknown function (DUF5675)
MNFTLQRQASAKDGCFGTLTNDSGFECVTLEHAYPVSFYSPNSTYEPKVVAGTYTCVLHQPNRLPYVTYELQNVPDFQGQPVSGILIHIGNFNKDSDGCILLGKMIQSIGDGTLSRMVASSSPTFKKFMAILNNELEFTLTIKDA